MSLERLAGEVMGQERKVEIRTPELAPRWRWRASGRDGHTDRVSEQLACGFRRRRHDRGRSEQPPPHGNHVASCGGSGPHARRERGRAPCGEGALSTPGWPGDGGSRPRRALA